MIQKIGFFSLLLLALTSCKVNLTKADLNEIESRNVDLHQVQYYNKSKIILTRTLNSNDAEIASGKVKMKDGKQIERIKIKRRAPGQLIKQEGDDLYVQFEEGANKYLVFTPDKNSSKFTYTLKMDCVTQENSSPVAPGTEAPKSPSQQCFVNYDGNKYRVKYNSTPQLMIHKKEQNNREVKKRTVKGIKVD